jgi:N-methylhydantoinase B
MTELSESFAAGSAARYGFDLIDLETVRYGLIEVAREMFETLTRGSFSPIARDLRDCTAAVHMKTDDGWQMVASWEGCVQHAFTSPHIVNFTMDEWDESTLREGDVIMVNDPWRGAIHCSDINLLRPVFVEGEVQFMLHSTSHVVDLGGPIPGGFSNGARTMFEEQLKFPPTLLYTGGTAVRPVFNQLLENNRVPHLLLGDIRALAGSLAIGAKRLTDVVERNGADLVHAAANYGMDLAELSMRMGLRSVPDGDYEVSDFLDDDGISGDAIELKMTVKIRGDSMEIDYSGSARQPAGNVGTAWIESTRAIIGAKFILDPHSPVNSGILRPIEAIMPPGSIVCVLPPSSCSTHSETGCRVVNMMTQALSIAMGDRAIACDSGTAGVAVIGGIDTREGHEGQSWGTFAVPGGGWGGTWKSDGVSACIVSIASNCRSSVQEHVERENPLVIWGQELMRDSAGAGKFRGGAGAVYTVRALSPTVLTIVGDRSRAGAPGSNGGGRGMPFYGWLLRSSTSDTDYVLGNSTQATPLFGMFDESGRPDPDHGTFCLGTTHTGKIAQLLLEPGDGVRLIVGGGGGWGDPLERDPELVLTDVLDDLVSPEFARRAYGVVIVDDQVDAAETARLRSEYVLLWQQGKWSVPSACPPKWDDAMLEVAR